MIWMGLCPSCADRVAVTSHAHFYFFFAFRHFKKLCAMSLKRFTLGFHHETRKSDYETDKATFYVNCDMDAGQFQIVGARCFIFGRHRTIVKLGG